MADAKRTTSTAEDAAEDQEAVAAAVEAPEPRKLSGRDKAIAKAHEAELKRQDDVRKAVADGADELAELGGPMLEPGLGR